MSRRRQAPYIVPCDGLGLKERRAVLGDDERREGTLISLLKSLSWLSRVISPSLEIALQIHEGFGFGLWSLSSQEHWVFNSQSKQLEAVTSSSYNSRTSPTDCSLSSSNNELVNASSIAAAFLPRNFSLVIYFPCLLNCFTSFSTLVAEARQGKSIIIQLLTYRWCCFIFSSLLSVEGKEKWRKAHHEESQTTHNSF